MNDLLIIIPSWNEEQSLPLVLEELESTPGLSADVVVVDDGSTDQTSAIARSHGVTVITLPLNLGVGGAMRAGYLYAQRQGYRYAVQLDADGQHRPEEIVRLLEKMVKTQADLIIGARFAGVGEYSVRGPRAWAMKALSHTLSRVCHAKLTDTTSGFKLANQRTISLFAHELPAEYLGDTIEALVIASRAGLSIGQVGVVMRARQGGDPSHGPAKAALFLGRALFAVAVAATRRNGKKKSNA